MKKTTLSMLFLGLFSVYAAPKKKNTADGGNTLPNTVMAPTENSIEFPSLTGLYCVGHKNIEFTR